MGVVSVKRGGIGDSSSSTASVCACDLFYILIWSVLGTIWFGVKATMLLVGMEFF